MKIKILFFSLLLTLALSIQAQSQKFLTVKGKEIIGIDGKPLLMKGTNLGNWLVPEGYMFKFTKATSPQMINDVLSELIGPSEAALFWKKYLDSYITEADIHYLKSIGTNSLRLPFNYKLFTQEFYMGDNNEARGFEYIDRLVKWCKKENMYIILDMHCAPGGQTGDNIDDGYGYPFLFENENDQKTTIDIWKRIAAKYKNEEIIMGYDFLNEPIAHFFDTTYFNPKLEPLYKKITAAVREVDKNHLIFLGGAQWDSNFKPFKAPFDNKLVYEFHKYWTDTTQNVIQEYIDFSNRYNVPIYVGETGENTDQWVGSFRRLLEKNQIGWHYWPYKKMENKSGIAEFKKPAFYDSLIAYAEAPRSNFSDIRKARPKDISQIKKALDGFLANCKYENCTLNEGYIKGLGLKAIKMN